MVRLAAIDPAQTDPGGAANVKKHHAEKRGGGTPDLSLEQMTRDGFEVADAWPPPAPDFDREWALTLLSNTLMEIRRDFEKRDRTHEFEILSTFLPGGSPGMSIETASGKRV